MKTQTVKTDNHEKTDTEKTLEEKEHRQEKKGVRGKKRRGWPCLVSGFESCGASDTTPHPPNKGGTCGASDTTPHPPNKGGTCGASDTTPHPPNKGGTCGASDTTPHPPNKGGNRHEEAMTQSLGSASRPGYLSIGGAAKYASVSRKTMKRWIQGGLPVFQGTIRGKVLIRPNDIDAYLTRKQVAQVDLSVMVNDVLRDLGQVSGVA